MRADPEMLISAPTSSSRLRNLKFARQVLQLSVYLLLAFGLLYILKRYVLVEWGILLQMAARITLE
jgi:hypothetical protein